MSRFRLFAPGTILLFALTVSAQQTATGPGVTDKDKHPQHAAQNGPATVDQQLKILTAKLELSGDQQAKVKPILQQLHDSTQKIVADKSLSHEERMTQARPLFFNADKQLREILSEDQKTKLDQYEQGPHPEMHGGLTE